MINRLINIKSKICTLLGRSDCGGEISEKPSLWGIEIPPQREILILGGILINKEKSRLFKYISVFRRKYRYKVLRYLGCILSDP